MSLKPSMVSGQKNWARFEHDSNFIRDVSGRMKSRRVLFGVHFMNKDWYIWKTNYCSP
jgi:hypothetical protein